MYSTEFILPVEETFVIMDCMSGTPLENGGEIEMNKM